jgi:hypothetical protein
MLLFSCVLWYDIYALCLREIKLIILFLLWLFVDFRVTCIFINLRENEGKHITTTNSLFVRHLILHFR